MLASALCEAAACTREHAWFGATAEQQESRVAAARHQHAGQLGPDASDFLAVVADGLGLDHQGLVDGADPALVDVEGEVRGEIGGEHLAHANEDVGIGARLVVLHALLLVITADECCK